ncbi:hypothetical protein Y032_0211g2172 [Ancylostoma ceylanicum]|uniref:Uncharacterized protein n=1 Tax=Ancylostoma ceylanicum TaxID=53326 RepID=A0A016SJV2_9BILA|nr:hypothetical protein Y032_0211g2172 [Ancylostoma ceylanicum]
MPSCAAFSTVILRAVKIDTPTPRELWQATCPSEVISRHRHTFPNVAWFLIECRSSRRKPHCRWRSNCGGNKWIVQLFANNSNYRRHLKASFWVVFFCVFFFFSFICRFEQ